MKINNKYEIIDFTNTSGGAVVNCLNGEWSGIFPTFADAWTAVIQCLWKPVAKKPTPKPTQLTLTKTQMLDDLIGQSRAFAQYSRKAYNGGHFKDAEAWAMKHRKVEKRINQVKRSPEIQFTAEVWA